MYSATTNGVILFTVWSTFLGVIESQNAPVWVTPAPAGDSVSVNENTSPGTTVYVLSATDADVGDSVTYTLRTVVPFENFFEISNGDLVLKSGAALNAESTASFTLSFFVSDGTYKVPSGELIITVQDVADETSVLSPIFIIMVQNQPQDFVVIRPDFSAAFLPTSYSLAVPNSHFTIDSSTGDLKTSSTPLTLTEGAQIVNVVAVASSNSATAEITIVPAAVASFQSGGDIVTAKSLTAGSVIYKPDFSVSNGLTYSITGGNTDNDFAFADGILTVAAGQTLDQATTSSYTLTLQIDDSVSISSASTTVTVNVNGAPVFTNPNNLGTSTDTIAENTAAPAPVLTLAASDPEGSTLTYSILFINPFDDFFEISTSNVLVKSGATLNREVEDTYTMYFTVTDGTTLVNSAKLVLTLSDVVDESDLFPDITERIVHKQPSGVNVLRLSFEEAFPATESSYIIVGTNPGYFTLDSSGSLFTTSLQLQYTPSTLETTIVTVKATHLSSTSSATITVTFSLDTGPEFASANVEVEILESSSTATTIFDPSITDADGDTVTYTMTVVPANAAADLSLDAGTGVITPAASLDYTVTPAYTLTLTAIDNTDSLSASATISITLNTPPVFVDPDPTSVPEISRNEGISGSLYSMSATDEDGDTLTYSIISISPNEQIFEVVGAVINLKSGQNLDYEGTKTYDISVQVDDEATPSQTATSTLRLRLNNLNDETPTFTNAPYQVSVKEGLPAQPSVLQVSSTDPDDISTTFTYAVDGNTDFTFNGDIFGTISALTYSSLSPVITVSIQVTDAVSGGNTASTSVLVTVLEATTPTFSSPTSGDETVSLDENSSPDQTLLTVLATDADGDTLTYSMPGLSSAFDFDPGTRELKTVSTFDYEDPSQRSYTLTVQVTDTNGTPNTVTGTITVNINDLNDEVPTFSQSVYTATIEAGVAQAIIFLTVVATDNDGTSPNNAVAYRIGGSPPSGISIDATTGALSATNVAFSSGTPVYTLSLIADDLNGPDPGANTATAEAQVTVVTVPVMTSPGVSTSIDVAEDKTPADILLTASSTDEDGDTGTYSLVTSTTKFNMTGTNNEELRLASGESLDFDGNDPTTYTLEISVSDDDSESATGTLTIQVTDVNDNPPVFGTITYTSPAITEQVVTAGTVATLTVTDADSSADDNNVINLSITAGDSGGLFSINAVSGTVFEVLGTNLVANDAPYSLTMTAKDRNGVDPFLSATTTLSVDVEQVPVFTNPPSGSGSTEVAESISHTTPFFTIAATDNTGITYSLFSQSTAGVFELAGNPLTDLQLKSGVTLDFETTTDYTLVFHAEDTAGLTGSGTLTVSVTDVNDNAPVFAALSNPYTVLERQQTTSSVVTVTASDADSALDDNNVVQYSITAGNTDSYFSIGASSGEITAVSNLVHSPTSIELTVVATDRNGGAGALSSSTTVTVSILKIPEFIAPPPEGMNITKPEDMTVTDVVFTLSATSDSTVQLSINSQTPAGIFELTGAGNDELKLVSNAQFDYEGGTQVYTIVFYAEDQAPRTASTTLTVSISDVNDNNPVFANFPPTVTVLEGATTATLILEVSASDADSSFQDNNVIQYSLTTGDPALFAVGASTGSITAVNLDYGTATSHSVVVTASDLNGAAGANTATASFIVNVATQPIFDTTTTTYTFQETLPASSSALTVTATDEDGGTVSYSIAAQDPVSPADIFVFNNVAGDQIDVGSLGLDRDVSPAVPVVTLTLQATDGTFTSSTTITINIEDLNDESPTFNPTTYTAMIPETAIIGSSVIDVTATDLDASATFNNIAYSITAGNPDSLFALATSPSNQINVANTLTFTSGSSIYTLTFEATDGTNTDTATVTVSVETEPVWDTTTTTYTLQESLAAASSALTVTATDADGGTVSYSIVEQVPVSPAEIFVFDSVTVNQINVGSLGLDREVSPAVATVTLGLQATDGTFSTTTSVTISIEDLNDYTPTFTQSTVTVNVLESTAVGSSVASVTASDLDPTPTFSAITYSIIGGNTGSLFELASSPAGLINVASVLDFVSGSNSYTLTIQASDGTNSGSATVTVNVKTAPVFTTPTNAVTETQAENIADTVVILTVSATDEDGDTLTYTLSVDPPAASSLFEMGGTENRDLKLATGQSLDFEASNWPYTITFSVEDPDGNTATSSPLTLNITDINDNAPTFATNPINAPVKSAAATGTNVLTLAATDADSSLNDNNVITYTLQSGNSDGKFALDSTSGVITTAGALSISTPNYALIIEAADGGTPSLSSTVTVSVTVVSDSDPVLTRPASGGETISISERLAVSSSVYAVVATDADFDPLTYSILSQTPSAKFILVDNELQVGTALDYESETSYTLTFQVDDNDGNTANIQTSGQLVINIQDENEYPRFDDYYYEVNVMEWQTSAISVIDLNAQDQDTGAAGTLTYSIIDGDPDNDFSIDSNGRITTTTLGLTRNKYIYYILAVQAVDGGSSQRADSVFVKVNVDKFNNHGHTVRASFMTFILVLCCHFAKRILTFGL